MVRQIQICGCQYMCLVCDRINMAEEGTVIYRRLEDK